MNQRKIYYLLHSGKNSKLKYYVRSYLRATISCSAPTTTAN